MIRYLFALLLASCATACAHAQMGWQWAAGSVNHGAGFMSSEAWAATADVYGNVYGGSNVVLADSTSYGAISVPNPAGLSQGVIVKLNDSGHYQWAVGTTTGSVTILSMTTDITGNLYTLLSYDEDSLSIGGVTVQRTGAVSTYAMVKMSPSGVVLWVHNLAPMYRDVYPPVPGLYPAALHIDQAGYLYAAARFYTDSVRIGATTLYLTDSIYHLCNTFVAKYDQAGNAIWATDIGGYGINLSDMAVSPRGTVYVTGQFDIALSSGSVTLTDSSYLTTGAEPFILKIDSSGHPIWGAVVTSARTTTAAIATDLYDDIVLTGLFNDSLTYGPATLIAPAGGRNTFLVSYDSSGRIRWLQGACSSNGHPNIPYSIAMDACGKICICGNMDQDVDIAPDTTTGYMVFDTETLYVPPHSRDPLYIAIYDYSGNILYTTALTSGGDDNAVTCFDGRGGLFACGDYYGTLTAGDSVLSNANVENFFVAKYHYSDTMCEAPPYIPVHTAQVALPPRGITLYPNPASGLITITSAQPFTPGSTAELCDISGRRINTYSLFGSATTLSLTGIAPGMYFCRILAPGGDVVVKKLVVD